MLPNKTPSITKFQNSKEEFFKLNAQIMNYRLRLLMIRLLINLNKNS